MSWFFLLVMGCFQGETAQFSQVTENYQLYQQALQLNEQGDWVQSISLWEELRQRDPESKAVLEQLLFAYLQGDQLVQGQAILNQLLDLHPGDEIWRLMALKYALKNGDSNQIQQHLSIVLHNKTFHPWLLAQDAFLQQYQNLLNETGLIQMSLLQVTDWVIPKNGLVHEQLLMDIEVLHLGACEIVIPPQLQNTQLDLMKVQRKSMWVDEVVMQTRVSLQWKVQNIGMLEMMMDIHCVDAQSNILAQTSLPQKTILLETLSEEQSVSEFGAQYGLELPSLQAIQELTKQKEDRAEGILFEYFQQNQKVFAKRMTHTAIEK